MNMQSWAFSHLRPSVRRFADLAIPEFKFRLYRRSLKHVFNFEDKKKQADRTASGCNEIERDPFCDCSIVQSLSFHSRPYNRRI